MPRSKPVEDPIEIVRRFRATYMNYRWKWNVPDSTTVMAVEQLDVGELPEELREQVNRYRESHPDETLVPLKHLRTVNGDPVLVVEGNEELPSESSLVTFSQALTVASRDELDVVVDVVIARRGHRGEHDT